MYVLSSEIILPFQKLNAVTETWVMNGDIVSDPGRSEQIRINIVIDALCTFSKPRSNPTLKQEYNFFTILS